jgi:hypothetical protein
VKLSELIRFLELDPIQVEDAESVEVGAAYCGDLLSDVLAHCAPDAIWFTVQGHVNVIAVAELRDAACVVLVNGVSPDPQTVAKAHAQGVPLCGSEKSSAELCMRLAGVL